MKLEYIKGCLKGKVKVTQALLVAFFITGGISYSVDVLNINNYGEETGLELGDQSRARGKGSIATGKRSIAIGNHAVATGNNETKESIEAKLAADKKSLEEIAQAKRLMEQKTKELKEKQLRERETIEAGIRVEEIQKSKEKARLQWQEDLKKWNTETEKSKDFLKEYQSKLDDLNSRLSGVSKIPNVDISSEEGLKKAALELKAMAEKNTTLNLSQEFYQDYISSYYKALGDLRLAEIRDAKSYKHNFNAENSVGLSHRINEYRDLDSILGITNGIYRSDFMSNTDLFGKYFLLQKNIKTDLSTEQEWKEAKRQSPLYKQAFREYFQANNNPNLTQETKDVMYQQFDIKVDYMVKKYEITYYQKMYEDTKNSTFLDKKVKALKELKELETQWESIVYPKVSNGYHTKCYIGGAIQYEIDKFRKENITDVKEKNKITVDKLTSELEQALGINKQAIQEKEKELKGLEEKAEQAKRNYEGLNISEEDKILAREYERVKQEVDALSQEVIQADERLKALKEALSLHDLKNIGENQIAIGTNSLAVGNNSIAFGTKAASVGENAISIGTGSTTTGEASISLGVKNVTVGNKSANIGYGNLIKGDNNFVFGNENKVGMEGSSKNHVFILGSHIDASKIENAVVLGNNSVGETGTVSVGAKGTERKIIHVADGIVDKDSKDAVNGSQLYSLANNPANFSGFDTNNWKKALGVGNVDLSNYDTKAEVDGKITENNKNYYNKKEVDDKLKNTLTSKDVDKKIDNKANKNLDNLSDAGKEKVRELAKESVKVVNGNNTTVEEGTEGNTKTYKVNVDLSNYDTKAEVDGKITTAKEEINKTTDNKITAAKEEINRTTDNKITENNKNYYNKKEVDDKLKNTLTSKDVDKKIDNKANKNLDNLSDTGKEKVRELAKESVKVVNGNNTTVEERTEGNTKTYKVNVDLSNYDTKAEVDGKITTAKEEINKTTDNKITTAKEEINRTTDNKITATKEEINRTTENKITTAKEEINKTTDNKITENNKNYYNKKEVDDKLKNTLTSEAADKKLDNKANKNLDNIGNIADKAKTTLTEALGTGTVTEHDTHLVTGKTVHKALKGKADADLSNVSKDTIMEKVSKGNVTSTTLKITNGENAALHAMTVDLKEGSIEKKHLGEGLSKTIDDLEDKVETHDIAIKALKNNKADKVETEKALNNLNENLNNEVKDRKSADRILKKAIEKEEVARKEADKAMEEKVNQEIVRSVAKDKEHDKAISTIAKQSIQNTKNINYIHNAVQQNKQAIANNARRIEAVDRKVNKTAALSTAMASLDFGKVKTGKIAVGAGIGGYHNEQAVAVGVAYQPTEDLLLTAKFSGVTGNPKYNSYGASVSYQFSVK